MKILVQAVKDNHLYGFKELFEARNHQWIWWEPEHTAAFDVFSEVRPELYIGIEEPNQVGRGIAKCLGRYRPATMFQIGPYTYEFQTANLSYPVLVDSVHVPATPHPEFICDIGCCEEPSLPLLHLCQYHKRFKIKILGDNPWPVPQYLGQATWQEKVVLYQSAKMVYANTVEEAGRALACKKLCITTNPVVRDKLNQTVYFSDDAETLADDAHRLLTSDQWEATKYAVDGHHFIQDKKLTYRKAFVDVCELLAEQGCRV